MPSIQDVADQINTRLDQVVTNTGATAQHTADNLAVSHDIHTELVQANTRLAEIDADITAGFANLSQGLYALLQVQLVALGLLDHHRRQNDTIICELVNGNELLCDINRKLATQLRLDAATLRAVERLEGIAERTEPGAAADYDRDVATKRQIEECCPPPPVPEEECPERCDVPKYRERRPDGQDWQPLPSPERPEPIG